MLKMFKLKKMLKLL